MTDPREWMWKKGPNRAKRPEPEPEPLPENWQAIAWLVVGSLTQQAKTLMLFVMRFRLAIETSDYEAFQLELERLEAWANDRPE
jgi:hypothetical protein